MRTYIYKGTIRTAAAEKQLVPGCSVELPEGRQQVKSLAAQGLLEPVKHKEAKTKKTKK